MTAIAAAEKKKKRDEMYYKFNTSRGMGYWKTRMRKYDDAVGLFSTAIENVEAGTNLELPLIIARSKAYTRLVDHEAARRDALAAVENNPDNLPAKECDAFTLYEKDDFEDSLVRHYRGLRRRRKPDYFYTGILVGKETLEDTVGRNAGPCLDHDRLGHVIVDMHVKPRKFYGGADELAQAKRRYEKEQIDRFFSQKYLGRLANDKKFLQDLLQSPDLRSGNKEHNQQLEELISHMVDTINRQQETLMTQRPMYMLKHKEPKFSQKYLTQKKELDDRLKFGVMKVVYRLLDELHNQQQERQFANCLDSGERLRRFVECQPSSLMSDRVKEQVLDKLYETIGTMIMDTKTLMPHWSDAENDRRIEFILCSYIDDPRFIDKARATYFPPIWNVKEMKKTLEARLAVSTHKIERAFLYHELSRCLFEDGSSQTEKAYKAAAAGYKIARENKNFLWSFNLGFQTALSMLMEGNTDDAKIAFREVNINARKLERDDCGCFIQRVIKIAQEKERLEYEPPEMEGSREKKLLNLMPTPELKTKAHLVMQRVNAAPRNARISLKPLNKPFHTVAHGSSRRSMRVATMAKRRTLYEVKSKTRNTQQWMPSKIDIIEG